MRKTLVTMLLFALLGFWTGCGGSDASNNNSPEDNSSDQAALQEAERELTQARQEAKEARQQAKEAREEAEEGPQTQSVEEDVSQLSPTETLEVQWQLLNAGQYEESYNLFAEQSQRLISLEDYSTSYSPTYEITDYTFFSEDIQGDTTIVEAELFLTGTEKGTQQYPITQELVLEDGEWRVVMRDAQAQALLEKQGSSSTEQAEQSTQSGDSAEVAESSNVIIRVTGNQAFSGNYGTIDSSRSVDGMAPAEYAVEMDTGFFSMDVVSAVIQKNGPGPGELGVEILVDGEVVRESSTTAEYGVADVTWSPADE